MVQMLNAQERSESEWREIVSAADSRLELTRIIVSNFSDELSPTQLISNEQH